MEKKCAAGVLPVFFVLFLLGISPAAAQAGVFDEDQARREYRAYLEQLKVLGKQYREVTGEMQKILQEEGLPGAAFGNPTTTATPEIREERNEMVVMLELPGLRKSSIRASLVDSRILRVSGQRKIDIEPRDIERVIELPATADEKGPHASYEDGILTVRVKKADTVKKEVDIPVS